jgi:GT2 family glycosyltransferase
MSSKKFTRWIDRNNYKTCLKIAQKYYISREQGTKVKLYKKAFLLLFIKRLFFVFINLFRFNRNPYAKYLNSRNSEAFLMRILGLFSFQVEGLLPEHPELKPLTFPNQQAPLVSIIIAVHNHLEYTYNCLLSILNHTQKIEYEIILINDCSSDQTAQFMNEKIRHITYLENSQNLGFLRSCNKAATYAKGKYIVLLNNDTQVRPDWLTHMISVFDNDINAGLVGCKLIYPYGLLQEAGGLVNVNGEPSNYGRFDDPKQFKYNYLRQTDYCSGAAVMLSKADFDSIGKFDEQYAPAYYEDTDLCFAVRYKLNKKVFYQPLSEIIHFEGISSGKTIKKGSIKEYQVINAEKFKKKWAFAFKKFPSSVLASAIADKFDHKRTILFIDYCLPQYDKASGYKRIFELLKIFLSLKYNVLFFAHNRQNTEPYYADLIDLGVRILNPLFPFQNPLEQLEKSLKTLDIAWISTLEFNEIYAPLIKSNPNTTWIYDTVDLHFVREERSLKVENILSKKSREEIDSIKQREIQLSKAADLTVAITDVEAQTLKKEGVENIAVIPNIHIPYAGSEIPFEKRTGICFIGGYDHQPNLDAVLWLVKEIMPLVWEKNPDIKLNLLGSNPTPEVKALQSLKVNVTGYKKDVSGYFLSSRVFVAPLRFGAGMKGKVGQSLEFKLPLVTTSIGAEGMNLENKYNAMIANTTEEFAHKIIDLYENKELWQAIQSNAASSIASYSPDFVKRTLDHLFPN